MATLYNAAMHRFLALLILLTATVSARADDAPKSHRYATLLARECDELIASAIKRPYGWGWAELDAPTDPKKLPAGRVPVSLEPGKTPAAGLLLLYASELLKEPKYGDAARNVARGVAAAQQPSGKFPSQALFGNTAASSKEPLAALPDRASTRASLALLLSLCDGDPEKQEEVIARAAARGAKWLLKQQADTGAWPISFPPGATPADSSRIVRLDTNDTRDTMLAMLLAYEVLGDPFQRRSAERSVEFLVKVRSGTGLETGPGLWSSACTLSGLPVEKSLGFADGYDTLASRYSMEAILGVWVILGDGQRLSAADLAARSIQDLVKNDDGHWHRHFNHKGVSTDTQATTRQAGRIFGPGEPQEAAQSTDPGLPPALDAVAQAKELGREKLRARLMADVPLKQQLAQVASGLSQDLMTPDFPTAPEQVAAYLKQHDSQFRLIDDGTEAGLGGKVARIWAIYLRAKLENRFEI
jgi:hypothetical protein